MRKKKVAVTGLGAVSPLGNNVSETWKNLMNGESGIAPITQFDASGFPVTIAAEVKHFTPHYTKEKKHHRYAVRFTRFALEAAHEAIHDAGFQNGVDVPSTRFGVVTGSGMMTQEWDYFCRFQKRAAPNGTPDWNLLEDTKKGFIELSDFGRSTTNAGLSLLIQEFGIQGYATSVHTACASGGQALGLALRVLERGDADIILAGGFDSMINPTGLSSFCLLGALSNTNTSLASRPFDGTRNGFVLGEGAAFLVLEDFERARARGAKIYAEFAGEGNSLSAYRITDSHPNGDGATDAIRSALSHANMEPSHVDAINAHGTSTKMNDLSETNAIKAVFGKKAHTIPVSATKSQTGHLIAGAGALEAVLSVLTLQTGVVPKTANLHHPDPECDLDYVTEGPREKAVGVILSNSFGFGGSNSCLLFKHPDLTGSRS